MTDRHAGFIVTLKDDVREDDGYTERVQTAIHMIAGVLSVEPVVADIDLHMATQRTRRELQERVWEFYKSLDETGRAEADR